MLQILMNVAPIIEDAVRFVLTMMARLFALVTVVMNWMQTE